MHKNNKHSSSPNIKLLNSNVTVSTVLKDDQFYMASLLK